MDGSFFHVADNICQFPVQEGFTNTVKSGPIEPRNLINNMLYLIKRKVPGSFFHAAIPKASPTPEIATVCDLEVEPSRQRQS